MKPREIQKQAVGRLRDLQRKRNDPRFLRVLGKLVHLNLMETNAGIPPYPRAISLDDALWVGAVEPRVWELLPALILKKPGTFRTPLRLPADLHVVVTALRHGDPAPMFRDIEPRAYQLWIPRIGHQGKMPSLPKTFRFAHADVACLRQLKAALQLPTETAVLRRALQTLARETRNMPRRETTKPRSGR